MAKFSQAFSSHHRLRQHISRFLNNVLKAEELGFPLVSMALLSSFNTTDHRLSLFIHGRCIVGFLPSKDCVRVVPGQTALVVCKMLRWDTTAASGVMPVFPSGTRGAFGMTGLCSLCCLCAQGTFLTDTCQAASSLGLGIQNNSSSIMCFDTPALYLGVGYKEEYLLFPWPQSYPITSKQRSLILVPVPATAALSFLAFLLIALLFISAKHEEGTSICFSHKTMKFQATVAICKKCP